MKQENAKYAVPTLYDIAGSANFYNKTDFGITVYRDMVERLTHVYVQKVRFRHWVNLAVVPLNITSTTEGMNWHRIR
jgi:hypothetical protein